MPTDTVAPPPLAASVLARMQRLQDLLDSGEADAMDMHGIAQCVGSNATTLQQQFRQLHGQTIYDYLRAQRLQHAATALQLRGVSIAEAAEMAGYTSPANFSTAFRRKFGFSPKHARQRL
jgi:AraC-like DNA-binding protein